MRTVEFKTPGLSRLSTGGLNLLVFEFLKQFGNITLAGVLQNVKINQHKSKEEKHYGLVTPRKNT
jgi:hypothetical protein